ncbi:MAG TPA: ABC transporter permease [Gemmataceae bacterium]|nr:ABC transporter permease [Gemmataceae bacterium]
MIFATFVLERDPLRWADMGRSAANWAQDAGGFALCGLIGYGIVRLFAGRSKAGVPPSSAQKSLTLVGLAGALVGYGGYLGLQVPALLANIATLFSGTPSRTGPWASVATLDTLHTLGGASALFVVSLPPLFDAARWRLRRIWAIARLSFLEAIRRKVVWGFTGLILVFLFASWFIQSKPVDQLRTYVNILYWSMTPLLLGTGGLLAAFSIPTDMKNQTIHTILTKPVERFEIVIGRFIGFMMLMTAVLAVMSGVSLLYVFREIDPDAKVESMRARDPIYGRMRFADSRNANYEGESVGREWAYRKYIAGGISSTARAVWGYADLPTYLASTPNGWVTCEFSFDIFRTLKGEEGKGVFCSFFFQTWRWDPRQRGEYDQAREKARRIGAAGDAGSKIEQITQEVLGRKPTEAEIAAFERDKSIGAVGFLIDSVLAEKYGYYEINSKEIADYTIQDVRIPCGLFKNAFAEARKPASPGGEEPEWMTVTVKCESGGQYLGFAKYDFYILASEGMFAVNFLKGTIGLWLRLVIVVGLGVVLSTYLSGVISFILTMAIYMGGFFEDFIRELASEKIVGGGPMESLVRMVNREAMTTPLQATPGVRMALGGDKVYGWIMRRVLDIIPDTDRLDWTNYVAEGFNIGVPDLIGINALMIAAYLLPCALVGYYLIKWREIASS